MNKIINYKIVTANTVEQLVKLVNIEIKNGWNPIGSMTQIQDIYKYYTQTMVKYQEDSSNH